MKILIWFGLNLGAQMFRKLGVGCSLAFALFVSAGSASAFGPVAAPLVDESADIQNASFFGRPYPYGYSGWGPCIRYVEVQTRYGVRVRRVRVCR